jgi:hypothetical protein
VFCNDLKNDCEFVFGGGWKGVMEDGFSYFCFFPFYLRLLQKIMI